MSSSSKNRASSSETPGSDSSSTPPSPSHTEDSEDDPADVIQFLVAKSTVCCEDDCPCDTFVHRTRQRIGGDTCKHWALRVGGELYEMRHRNGRNFYEPALYDARAKELYDERPIIGRTRTSTRIVQRRGKCKYTRCRVLL